MRRTRHDFEELERLLFTELPKESAAFALAGAATHRGGTDVIVRHPVAIPDAHFSIQGEYHLRIATAALNGLFDRQVRAFGREGKPRNSIRTIAPPSDGGVSTLSKQALLCDLEHDRPRPAVVRLQIKSMRARKPGHPMVRETDLCATHARQLRNLGLEFVSA
ncbi:MAG: hypothetical protein ACREJ4_09015 [Candidatus Methylomirabilaceae bacterium]